MFPTPKIDWDWILLRDIESDMDQGHAAIEELMSALERSGWEGRELFHIRMAVEEGVENAIEHGNQRDPGKRVRLDFRVSPAACYIQITDQGTGFCRADLRDCTHAEQLDQPRGRGVHLIEQLMSETSYNECGNQLTMLRRRHDPKLAIARD